MQVKSRHRVSRWAGGQVGRWAEKKDSTIADLPPCPLAVTQ